MSKMTVREMRTLELLKSKDSVFAERYITTTRDQKLNVIYITSDEKVFLDYRNAVDHEVEILNTVVETGE